MRAPRRRGLRWLAASAGLAVAGATVLAMAPAHADAATVDAQLSLSGVATSDNVLGGSAIGVRPGDTVRFKASPLPTAGLDDIPSLGPLLDGVLSKLLGSQFQVVVSFGDSFPGVGGQQVAIGGPTSGKCEGRPDVPVKFPAAGTYSFTWTVQYVLPGLLGCQKNGLSATSLNQLQQAGIAINASNRWVGRIVVADNPPKGGIAVQLPGVGAAPSVPVVGQLPGVTLPPVTTPTLPVGPGNLALPGLTNHNQSTAPAGGKKHTSSSASVNPQHVGPAYKRPQLTVPEMVVPKGYGNGVAGSGNGAGSGGQGVDALSNLGVIGDIVAGGHGPDTTGHTSSGPAAALAVPSSAPPASDNPKIAQLAATSTSGGGPSMPVTLAIVAIVALAVVTGSYAYLYLLRRK